MAAAVPVARAPFHNTHTLEFFNFIYFFQPQDHSMVVKTIALSPPLVSRPFICPPMGGGGDWENLCCALEEELRPRQARIVSRCLR